MGAKIKIILLNDSKIKNIPTKKKFHCWVNAVFKKLKTQASEITIAIVDSRTSSHLNKTFRNKKGATNILSFVYDDFSSHSLGDLAICASLVKKEAENQKKLLAAHWAHLTIHGVLHLLGYDHLNNPDTKKMESLEIKILKGLGFKNPY